MQILMFQITDDSFPLAINPKHILSVEPAGEGKPSETESVIGMVGGFSYRVKTPFAEVCGMLQSVLT